MKRKPGNISCTTCTWRAPRLINKACSHCLIYGQQQHKMIIDDHMVKQVVASELL